MLLLLLLPLLILLLLLFLLFLLFLVFPPPDNTRCATSTPTCSLTAL
jgi:hypothetical protein